MTTPWYFWLVDATMFLLVAARIFVRILPLRVRSYVKSDEWYWVLVLGFIALTFVEGLNGLPVASTSWWVILLSAVLMLGIGLLVGTVFGLRHSSESHTTHVRTTVYHDPELR